MKKRFLSIILAVFVIMSVISVPAFAYSRICEDINFDKFNASDWTSAGAKYGTLSNYGTSYPNVVTYVGDETKDRNNDGKSLKLEVNANSGKTDFPGFKYVLNQALTGTIHISASHLAENHSATGCLYKYISMVPVNGSEVSLVTFTDAKTLMTFKGISDYQSVTHHNGSWIDVDIVYNLDNNSGSYKVSSGGTTLFNKSFSLNDETYKDGISEIRFYTQTPKWLSSKYNSDKTKYSSKEVMYWDNVKIETVSSSDVSGMVDFNSATPSSSTVSSVSFKPSDAPWNYAYANISGGNGFSYVNTDRGVSLKLLRPTGATLNPNLRMNFDPYVPTVKTKVSLMVPDTNIAKPMYIVTNGGDYVSAILFYDNGNLSMFGNHICAYKTNCWYDFEYVYNAQNGAYFYKVSDGENIYIGSGTYTQSKGYPQTIQRSLFQLNKANTYILIDDFMLDTVASDFRLDRDISVNGKTLATNETVYARFTKELNETSETLANKVFEYYGNAQITSVSLLDKYTVKAEFEKEMGKNYRIDFKNIAASDGSTTSDYIEFDVKKEDLYLTDSIFKTESGEIPALLKAGKITSSIDACANNGKSFKFIYALALYGDSELKAIDSDIINIGSQEQTYTRTLTVPSDGSYVLKAFVWDAVSLEPIRKPQTLKATPDNKPVAIVKLDDLRADNDTYITPFTDIASWSGENGIRISAGIIGESLETSNATEERIAKIKALANNKNIELWFHGYANANTFASDDNEQAQREDFQKGIAAAAKHGITFKSFNPPSNNMRPITAQLIENEFTNFTTVMALSTSGQAYSSYLDRCNDLFTHIKVEPSATGNTDTVDNLKALWNSMSSKKYVLLQAHPAGWRNYEGSEERFKEFLLWLKSEGVVFMTPSEYTAYINTLN